MNLRPLEYKGSVNCEELIPDFLQCYLHVKGEINDQLLQAFGRVLETIITIDSDHAHNQKSILL